MPRRKTNVTDIRDSIDAVLIGLSKNQGGLAFPIDLAEVCRAIGVEWEFRWMIPEGVTAVIGDKLKIFIRNNFSEEDTIDKRQRFTWAHEICHALLYDLTLVPPKPAADTPKDAQLEALCQSGAGYLLMPTAEIKRVFNFSRPVSSIDDVVALSEKFGASYEVVIRRLKQVSDCLRADYALILLRNAGGENAIAAAAHDIWLKTPLPLPGEGQMFSEWAKPFVDQTLQVGPNDWEKGRVKMCLQQLSRYWTIAEFKQT